jgi:hypothetical protein
MVSLKVSYTEQPFIDVKGNLHLERSSAPLADGSSADMTDVDFNVLAADVTAAGVDLAPFSQVLGNSAGLDANLNTLVTGCSSWMAAHWQSSTLSERHGLDPVVLVLPMLTTLHRVNITRMLRGLMQKSLLVSDGTARDTRYTVPTVKRPPSYQSR